MNGSVDRVDDEVVVAVFVYLFVVFLFCGN